ncbi:MAG TPA: hypothetical protein VFH58_12515 [Acidimicrobiales bacterium]|nr:hypothetical protein [Acidimicrobiales bacterium]
MRRLTRLYGAGPGHAVLMVGGFAFAGYLASRIVRASHPGWIAIWLAGAIVAHDLVLFPLYTLADRLYISRRGRRPGRPPGVPWRNHVRVPVVLAGLMLLITFPLVFRLSEPNYVVATGLHTSVYLGRWLAVSGAGFALSAVVYGARRVANSRRPPR